MDTIKREELKKAYRKENDFRVALEMVAVYMVRVQKISLDETVTSLMRSGR